MARSLVRHAARCATALLLALALLTCVAAESSQLADTPPPPPSIQWAHYLSTRGSSWRPEGASPSSLRVSLLHLNDLYELLPSGGRGGVARVGTIRRQLHELNPRTLTLLGGDLFSPSALSTVPIERLGNATFDGMQMVAAMNALGLDYATLGNHETDVKESSFNARIAESEFPWLCLNQLNASAYPMIQPSVVHSFPASNETEGEHTEPELRVGIFGLTLDSNNKYYQGYLPVDESIAMTQPIVDKLRAEADIVVGLTHLPYWDDATLVRQVRGIDIVLGGHEHTRIALDPEPQKGIVGVYKADSNVNSVWLHDLFLDLSLPLNDPQRLVISSVLVDVDASIEDDPDLARAVDGWVDEAFAGFELQGFSPRDIVCTVTRDLDGKNDVIYGQGTELTHIFNLAMLEEAELYRSSGPLSGRWGQLDATLFNAGAIRIDDVIVKGAAISQYDSIRISPYQNAVAVVNITGSLLRRALDASQAWRNESQFLHGWPNVTAAAVEPGPDAEPDAAPVFRFELNGEPLDEERWYVVGFLAFLLEGKAPYEILLPEGNSEMEVLALDNDISDVRRSLIRQLARRFPDPTPGPDPDKDDDDGKGWPLWLYAAIVGGVLLLLALLVRAVVGMQRRKREAEHSVQGDAHAYRAHNDELYPEDQA